MGPGVRAARDTAQRPPSRCPASPGPPASCPGHSPASAPPCCPSAPSQPAPGGARAHLPAQGEPLLPPPRLPFLSRGAPGGWAGELALSPQGCESSPPPAPGVTAQSLGAPVWAAPGSPQPDTQGCTYQGDPVFGGYCCFPGSVMRHLSRCCSLLWLPGLVMVIWL